MSALAVAELRDTLLAHAADADAWRHLVRHEAEERTYALLHRGEEAVVYVVCWMPGHDTGFHDHDASAAAITVVDGAVNEERLALAGTVKTRLEAGDVVTIAREAIHRVRHTGDVRP